MLSYVIAHKNRTELFAHNLLSLAHQTNKDFEVLVVDHSDGVQKQALKSLVSAARNQFGMAIKLYTVDITKHPYAHPITTYGGHYNPGLSQNIGVRKAAGDIICLTSPEVVNASTNVEHVHDFFSDGRPHFMLGWVDEKPAPSVHGVLGNLTCEKIKSICTPPSPHGAQCRDDVPSRPWGGQNYFLGFIKKEDYVRIGGIEERFLQSIYYEDDFFALCCRENGMSPEFNSDVCGIHLTHPRGYQQSLQNINLDLWRELQREKVTIANAGFDWGDDKYITDEF